jgi:CTP synthase (UTP-ammonia lyase)
MAENVELMRENIVLRKKNATLMNQNMRLILELKEKEHLIFKQNVVLAKYRKRYTHNDTTRHDMSRNELTQPSARVSSA